MTVKRWITLHHLLILLCLVTIPLLVYKGIGISQKLTAIETAERLFQEKRLVEAEDWYRKAQMNRSIRYKEELISSRLEELAPISAIKGDLGDIADQASRADSEHDFELLMNAYAKLQQVRSRYMTPEGPYSGYYRQISENYGISQSFTSYFKNFKSMFLRQLEQNLTVSNYDDESFKRNLLSIPAHFFGTEQEWLDEVKAAFQSYDETKLTRLVAGGFVESMLDDASSTLAAYQTNNLEAPWIVAKVDHLIEELLKKDWDNADYAAFAIHAQQFDTFASSSHPESMVLSLAKSRIGDLMRKAGKNVVNGNYQEAIDLYAAIGHYQDTQAEISATELAWTLAEPVRLLPSPADGSSYEHVASGRDNFGSKVYVAATDRNNQLYFGRMSADESVQILSNHDLTPQEQIRAVAIDPVLSAEGNPVIVIEAASETRNALYTAFEARENNITLLYAIEGDSLTLQPDGTLQVVNPVGPGEGQTAIFVRSNDGYQFASIKQDIADISADNIVQYPDKLVRFTCTVISAGPGEALAMGSNSLMLLKGDFSLPAEAANVTVTGRFKTYAEQSIDEQLIGRIEEVLKGQLGGQTSGRNADQADGLGDGLDKGLSVGAVDGQIEGLVDGTLNGLLQGLNDANQLWIPVVEVESIRQ
ncbi:hypothetical protein [Paenibacillus macerans]|uniref:hypothetical protein n=1 Tax=Paenibacillus macerans TaxID=44252 RepID=UPI003D316A87